MSLFRIISVLSNSGRIATTVPFNDTIELSIDEIVDNNPDYDFLGNYLRNPNNGKIINVFCSGDIHIPVAGKTVKGNISLDNGQSRGANFVIYDPSSEDSSFAHEVGCGYDSNGRLHFFCSIRDGWPIGSESVDRLKYFYSDDDGSTISTPVTITYPSDGLSGSWPTGRMIQNNGVLLKNYYRIDASPPSQSANYLLRSTDGGANWSTITVRSGADYYNEADIIAISDTELIVMLRDEVNGGYQQYYSDDNGLTWNSQGNTQLGETWTLKKPPSLRSFRIKGTLIVALYSFIQKSNGYTFVVYAKASDLPSGVSAWNLNTKITLLEFVSNVGVGYGNEVHFNNSLQAVGNHYYATSNDDTDTYYYTLPTTHYQTLITEFGL